MIPLWINSPESRCENEVDPGVPDDLDSAPDSIRTDACVIVAEAPEIRAVFVLCRGATTNENLLGRDAYPHFLR